MHFSTSESQKAKGLKNASFCHFWLPNALRTTTAYTFWHLNVKKWSEPGVFCAFWLGNVLRATTACTFSTSQLPKSGPRMVCFVHFDLEMCFAPQRRALFWHFHCQKWSENGVLCAFWHGNVLRASRHNGVHFFDSSTSKSAPKLRCFVHFYFGMCFAPQRHANFHLSSGQMAPHPALVSLLFDHPEPQIIGKTQWTATFLPFRAPASCFFSLFLFSALLTSWLLLSDSSHLCFSICPCCRKFDF